MDDQIVLLTSIRDILTRIERVLEKIEAKDGMAAAAELAAAPVAAVAVASPAPAVSSGAKPGAPKWRSR